MAGGLDQWNSYMNQGLQADQQQYLRDRMNLVEIPMMETDRRVALAKLDADYGAMTGWYAMGPNGPKGVPAGTSGAQPSFLREQWNQSNQQWQQQFGAQNWKDIANMLMAKSGPRDVAIYQQLQPNAAFGAMMGTPSWEQAFVNWFNSGGMQGAGQQGTSTVAGTPAVAGTPGPWQLPQGLDWQGIQRQGDVSHIATPQDPTLNASSPGGAAGGDHPADWWKAQIRQSIPGAPESYVDAMYNQILANYKQAGWNLLVDMPNQPAPNYIQQSYNAWARMQPAAVAAQAAIPGTPAVAGTPLAATAKPVPFMQPNTVRPQDWKALMPTERETALGNVSYSGIDPNDWWANVQAGWPTGRAPLTTTWG